MNYIDPEQAELRRTEQERESARLALEKYTGITPFTQIVEIRDNLQTTYEYFARHQSSPADIMEAVLPTYDVVALQLAETTNPLDIRDLKQTLDQIRYDLTNRGLVNPEMYSAERVLGRIDQLSPENVEKRARALGVPVPQNRDEMIAFTYKSIISHVLENQERQSRESASPREQAEPSRPEQRRSSESPYRELEDQYYDQDPQLDPLREINMGSENAIQFLQRYDQFVAGAINDRGTTQNEDGSLNFAPHIQRQLGQWRTRIEHANLNPEQRGNLLQQLDLNSSIQRSLDKKDFGVVLGSSDPFEIIGIKGTPKEAEVNRIRRDTTLTTQERSRQLKDLLRAEYRQLIRRWHTDRNNQGSSQEMATRINQAHQALTNFG